MGPWAVGLGPWGFAGIIQRPTQARSASEGSLIISGHLTDARIGLIVAAQAA